MHLSRRMWLAIVVVAFLGLCAILRAPINVIPPLLTQLGTSLSISDVALGALTSIPVLCFGLMTPAASVLLRRIGANTGGVWTILLIILGALLRSAGSVVALFVGTLLIGAGITIGNLVAPIIIGRDFWHRTALMMSMYSAINNVLVAACTALVVPTAVAIGWQGSAAAWSAVPALLALVLWLWVFPIGAKSPRAALMHRSGMENWVKESNLSATSGRRVAVWRRPLTWIMTIAFAAHTFGFYAVSGWLPTALKDLTGMGEASAGVASSVFSLTGIVGALLVPVMFDKLHWSGARIMAILSICWFALPVCLLIYPVAWLVPCIFSGIAQGAFFSAIFTLAIQRTVDVDDNRRTTAFMQTFGYVVAALGPVVVGWAHTATASWSVPVAIIILILAIMTICGQLSARPPKFLQARTSRTAA